jgi:membrane fusion protein (multidrug efflux system)
MKRWYLAVTTLALLLFGVVIGFKQLILKDIIAEAIRSQANVPAPVVAVEVSQQSWQPTISSISFVEPVQGVELSIAEAGLVETIHFESGEQVSEGQLLLELDSTVEQANLKAAQARLPAAKSNYQRALRLYKNKTGSKQSLDNAESEYQSLIAQIESLKSTIARRRVTAPFAGLMGIRDVDIGQYLQGGAVVAALQDISAMRLRFFVPQNRFAEISIGMPVQVKTDAYPERIFHGSINAIDPVVDPDSGVINVQAEIPNPEQLLRSGMYAETEVVLPVIKDAAVVPETAVSFSLYGQMVFVIESQQGEDGEAFLAVQQRRVNVGQRRGDQAYIKSGLQAGELIVQSGHVRLSNGSRVYLVEQDFVDIKQALPKD